MTAIADDEPGWPTAIVTAMAVPPILALVYCGCAWLVSSREVVHTAAPWESSIPLVPWMIIPYLSLDPLLVVTPFACRSRYEARRLTAALLAAGVVAGACFLVFPTTGSSPQPVSGVLHEVFEALQRCDTQKNALPSLHAALTVILWHRWSAHTLWPAKWAVHFWFALMLASTVLTHQHSINDLLAGCALGAIAVIIFLRMPAVR